MSEPDLAHSVALTDPKQLTTFRTLKNSRLIQLVARSISEINDNIDDDIEKFVETLLRVSGTSESTVIVSLILMNRLIKKNGASTCGKMIYVVCLVISTKILLEPGFTNGNKYSHLSAIGAWARLLKLQTADINMIEMMILDRLKYNTYVSMHQFWKYKKSIVEYQLKKKTS